MCVPLVCSWITLIDVEQLRSTLQSFSLVYSFVVGAPPVLPITLCLHVKQWSGDVLAGNYPNLGTTRHQRESVCVCVIIVYRGEKKKENGKACLWTTNSCYIGAIAHPWVLLDPSYIYRGGHHTERIRRVEKGVVAPRYLLQNALHKN